MQNPMTESRVRMLRLITRLNIGGPARQALTLTKELRPEFATTLAAGTPASDEGELSDPEVKVTRVPLVRPVAPAADFTALRDVRKLISVQRPQIVHTHMAKAGSIGRLASLRTKQPPRLVHTFHGHVLDGYFRPAVREAFLRTERYLARRTDALVAVSDEIRDELLELGIGAPGQWHVIPLGFDLAPFLKRTSEGSLRRELSLGQEVSLAGIVGRLVPIKDHATALRALARLGENIHLVVVGDGEDRDTIEKLVVSLGLKARVHFLGWRLDMPEVMSSFDVVVLSSRNEGSPVALIEALASGVPCVATDVGGVRSVVADGESGYLVPAGDDAAMAAAVAAVLEDPERSRSMGEAGRAHVRTRFDQVRLVSDIRMLYEGLLSQSR